MRTLKALFAGLLFSASFGLAAAPASAMGDGQWEGLYGGYATSFTSSSNPKDNIATNFKNKIGAATGGVIGWNYVSDQFLFGVEVDGMIGNHEIKGACLMGTCENYLSGFATFRARGGWLFGENRDYLVYLTGGLGMTDVESNYFSGGTVVTKNRWVTGFTAGGGIETWLFQNRWITTKLEYLYTDVPNKNYWMTTGAGASPFTYRFGTGIHQIRSSWNLHF